MGLMITFLRDGKAKLQAKRQAKLQAKRQAKLQAKRQATRYLTFKQDLKKGAPFNSCKIKGYF